MNGSDDQSDPRRKACRYFLSAPVGLALALLGLCGCGSARVYTAADLPAEFQAAPVENVQTLDLSRLAAPTESNERINAGDVIDLSIVGGLGADAVTRFPIRVGDDGAAIIPEVGAVQVAGLELGGAEQVIAAACVARGLYLQPTVNVTINRRRVNRITVVGAVKQPGMYELPPGSCHLLSALVAAGGLAEDAGTSIEIRQPFTPNAGSVPQAPQAGQSGVRTASATTVGADAAMQSVRIDLAESVARGGGGGYLADGSVVMVEKRKPVPIQVIGLVRNPGQYEYPVDQCLHVLGALALAGGLSNQLADKILVIRRKPHVEEPVVIVISLRRAKRSAEDNLRLQPGDVVSVEPSPATVLLEAVNIIRFSIGSNIPLF